MQEMKNHIQVNVKAALYSLSLIVQFCSCLETPSVYNGVSMLHNTSRANIVWFKAAAQ